MWDHLDKLNVPKHTHTQMHAHKTKKPKQRSKQQYFNDNGSSAEKPALML